MRKVRSVTLGLALFALAAGWAAAHGGDHVTVLAGAGQDTTVVSAFLPGVIRVEVGTTVTWRLNGDEVHTVTFLGSDEPPHFAVPAPEGQEGIVFNPQVAFPSRPPGAPVETYAGSGFVNSGMLSAQAPVPDAPPNDSFSVTFTEPGTYEYHCMLHPWMKGTVVVEPSGSDVPAHEELDAAAQAEAEPLLALVDRVRQQAEPVRTEPGPNGTTVWYLEAGAVDFVSGDARASAFEFFPRNVTIEAGDTVIWTSPEFHTVTFAPLPPGPEPFAMQPVEAGPPLIFLNMEVFGTVKPDAIYDPLAYFNSGVIGRYAELGQSWMLTFDEPGTYEYYCALHREMGMEGTITVVAR